MFMVEVVVDVYKFVWGGRMLLVKFSLQITRHGLNKVATTRANRLIWILLVLHLAKDIVEIFLCTEYLAKSMRAKLSIEYQFHHQQNWKSLFIYEENKEPVSDEFVILYQTIWPLLK